MPHDHVKNKPLHTQVPPVGHDPGVRTKIPDGMGFFLSFICKNTNKVWYKKIFEIVFVVEI